MHLVRKSWSRRDFLRAAGIAGGAAALASWMPAESRAATTGLRRLLLVQTGNGSILEKWRTNGSGQPFVDGQAIPELAGPILAPLEAHRQRLLLLDGIDLSTMFESASSAKPVGPNKGHAGSSVLWTGLNGGAQKFPDDGGAYPTGPSVDQVINERIGEGRGSLQLAIWNRPIDPRTVYAYDENGTPLPPEPNPQVVFDDIFRDGFPSDQASPGANRIVARRQRTIEHLRGELARLRDQWPAADRERFDRHVSGLDALEARIASLANGPTCSAGPDDRPTIGKNFREDPNATTDVQIDNIVHAFACDRARVASFNLSPENSWIGSSQLDFLGWTDPDALHDGVHTISHATNLEASETNRKKAVDQMAALNRWHAEKLARILSQLEANGLLDDTLVVWGTAMSHGGKHSNRNVPIVIAQGSAGPLATGRYLRWGDYEQPAWSSGCKDCYSGDNSEMESNNNLLITLCHAFGLDDVTEFGSTMKSRASGLDGRLMK